MTVPTQPPYRTFVDIAAPPEAVYPYLTRAEAIVAWMGDHAVLDARPGGVFHLDINGVPVRGRFLELDPPHRIVVSWGHAGSGRLPPGAQHRRDHPHPDPDRHPRHGRTPRPATGGRRPARDRLAAPPRPAPRRGTRRRPRTRPVRGDRPLQRTFGKLRVGCPEPRGRLRPSDLDSAHAAYLQAARTTASQPEQRYLHRKAARLAAQGEPS